jgi:hypothetical protein
MAARLAGSTVSAITRAPSQPARFSAEIFKEIKLMTSVTARGNRIQHLINRPNSSISPVDPTELLDPPVQFYG